MKSLGIYTADFNNVDITVEIIDVPDEGYNLSLAIEPLELGNVLMRQEIVLYVNDIQQLEDFAQSILDMCKKVE